jgi:cysteine desulfurase
MRKVYLDHSATTAADPRVIEKMLPFFSQTWGNASSLHSFGREARISMSEARETLAGCLAADPGEIIFTSGGTEADNLAIKGLAGVQKEKRHLITSAVEHHAVLRTCEFLEKKGFQVTYLPVDSDGLISPEVVQKNIRKDTFLISIMHANNEVGTINPIQEIGEIAQAHKILLHCDAVQTFGKLSIDVKKMKIDLLTISGHKIYGPKGIGALYLRKGLRLEKQIHGGHHEYDRRAGTENLPGIVGLAEAAKICQPQMQNEQPRIAALRDTLFQKITGQIPRVHLNGHPQQRLAGHLNLTFEGIEGEALLLSLDMKGIAASSGSACTAGNTTSSHVLLAMGRPPFFAQSSIRLTLGRENTVEDIDYTAAVLPEIVARLRQLSPLG